MTVDHQDTIDRLLEHYASPQNHGPLADADVVVSGGQPECGDTVTIYLKIDATNQHIEQLSFEGKGCSVSQATASLLTELLSGAPLTQIDAFDTPDLIALVGRDIVRNRPRCASLALNTLKTALAKYRGAANAKDRG